MERIEQLLQRPVSRRWILHATVIGLAGGALGAEIQRKSRENQKTKSNTKDLQPEK